MNKPPSRPVAHESLRRLTTPHALDFGSRLLRRGAGSVITFREFVAVARECWQEAPDGAATYLAALVALDMATSDDDVRHAPTTPSPN